METLDENLGKIDDVELIDDSNKDDILVDETEEKKENNIFDTVIDVNDEESLLDEEIVKEEAEVIQPESDIEAVEVKEDVKSDVKEEEKIENNIKDHPSYKVLIEYGENLTDKEYITNPAIGRDNEMKQLIVILLTPEKSGILVGKPGIGKTAIVEGLSYKIQRGEVPDALKGYTIFKLNSAALTGIIPGTQELKVQHVVSHLKNLDKVMVFIDEIHTLIGNGENTMDFANIFKPVIDRGTIKIIGATTSDEYDRYILRDKAFVRRFQKIEVSEPTREMNIQIMMGTYPKFEKKMGLKHGFYN